MQAALVIKSLCGFDFADHKIGEKSNSEGNITNFKPNIFALVFTDGKFSGMQPLRGKPVHKKIFFRNQKWFYRIFYIFPKVNVKVSNL